jgi:uncharacterized protein YbcI
VFEAPSFVPVCRFSLRATLASFRAAEGLAMSETMTDERVARDRLKAKISDEIVRLLAVHTGHGATRAWTTLDDDLIVCVLQDVLSKGEQNLVRGGEREIVLRTRSAYQEMMRREAVDAVEQLSGRTVKAFTSANHLDADLAVEIFVLEPLAS